MQKKCPFGKKDIEWIFALFGTAIGAGVLFLPIRAGVSGFLSILVMTAIMIPLVWWGHRSVGYFILSANKTGSDITEAMKDHLGPKFGYFMTLMYLLFLWPVMIAYSVGLINTIISFMANQLHMSHVSLDDKGIRAIVVTISLGLIVFAIVKGLEVALKVTNVLTYPLVAILILFSLWLIPQWNLATVMYAPKPSDFIVNVWLSLPVLAFSFNHSPAISSMVQDLYQDTPDKDVVERRINKIELGTMALMLCSIMFFVISCALTLTPQQLLEAREQNISILSYFANTTDNKIIAYLGPLISFAAIGSSFFGHFLGCIEALRGTIVKRVTEKTEAELKRINFLVLAILSVTMILGTIYNPGILSFIEGLGGPIIAFILFVMPIYGFYTAPAMQKYRKNIFVNMYVLILGILTVSCVIYQLIGG